MSGVLTDTPQSVLSALAPYVDGTGAHAPDFAAVQSFLQGRMQAIYGGDIVLTPDSQDGQIIGIFSLAIADTLAAFLAAYNSFGPQTAQGVGLSNAVKINGMRRNTATNSTVQLVLTGQAGTIIRAGQARGDDGSVWDLPPIVTIASSGDIMVMATADTPGAVAAAPNTIRNIATPTYGWQEVTNPAAALPGAPLESDAALRARQAFSAALPSASILSGIAAGIAALPGVVEVDPYENDTDETDPVTGLPPHSISMAVSGGDPTAICQTILNKKTPGCYTYGTTRVQTADSWGLMHDIGFFASTALPIEVEITLAVTPSYSTLVGAAIADNVAAWVNALKMGVNVITSKLWAPANLCDDASGLPASAAATFDIQQIRIAPLGGTLSTDNIVVDIFVHATLDPANVNIVIV